MSKLKKAVNLIIFTIIILLIVVYLKSHIEYERKRNEEELTRYKEETEIVNLKKTIPSSGLFYKVDTKNNEITFVNSKGEVIEEYYKRLIVKDSNEDEIKLKINYLIEYTKKDGEVGRQVDKVTIYEKQK